MNKILLKKSTLYNNPMMNFLGESSKDEVVNYIKRVLSFEQLFTMINTLDCSYNERMIRMIKSELLSRCVERASRQKIHYVNQIGYDFIIPELDIKLEFKSGRNIFRKDHSSETERIKLDNTNGQDSRSKIYTKTFDYLLMIDVNRAGLISYEDIQPFIKHDGDGRSIKLPKSKIEFIAETRHIFEDEKIYIDDRIESAMNQMIDDVFKSCAKR
jgi:hypothetical protein